MATSTLTLTLTSTAPTWKVQSKKQQQQK